MSSLFRTIRCLGVRCIAATAVILTMSGCATTRVTPFDPAVHPERRTSADAIRLYGTQLPSCPYVELGRVTAQGGEFVSWGRVVRAARKAAHEMGGDAIVGVRDASQVTGAVLSTGSVTTTQSASLSGIVIRFTDAACMSSPNEKGSLE